MQGLAMTSASLCIRVWCVSVLADGGIAPSGAMHLGLSAVAARESAQAKPTHQAKRRTKKKHPNRSCFKKAHFSFKTQGFYYPV